MRSLPLVLAALTWPALAAAQGPEGRAGTGADAMFDEMPGDEEPRFTLHFFDALTGKPIRGAKVSCEGEETETDDEGRAKLPFPEGLKPDEDRRHAVFSHPKYVTSKIEVRFMLESVWFSRYSISPKLPPGRVRLVLDWGKEPLDLDAHLVKEGEYHISYQDMKKWRDLVLLDRDDQDGFGPETITINKLDPKGRYTFFIHDYSNKDRAGADGFEKARAHVRVYANDQLVEQIAVPKGRGRFWKVLEIKGGEIKIASELGDGAPR